MVSNKLHSYKMSVRKEHIDASEHVNNSHYLSFFEAARWAIFENTPYAKSKMHALGLAPVLLDCSLRFRKELLQGEEIEIQSRVIKIEKDKLIHFHQELYKQDGKKACTAKLRHGVFDLKQRLLIDVPSPWYDYLL